MSNIDCVKCAITNTNWTIDCDGSTLKLSKVESFSSLTSKSPVIITHCLSIKEDLKWELFVYGKLVHQALCPALSTAPEFIDGHSINSLLQLIESLNVFAGHSDDKFVTFAREKKGRIGSAVLDEFAPVLLNGDWYNATVRSGTM